MEQSPLQRLSAYGQSPWIDGLSRTLLRSGQLERLVRDHGIRGVISDHAALASAVRDGIDYDEQILALLAAGEDDPETIAYLLAVQDARAACDLLRTSFGASGRRDGYVSLAVEPRHAHELAGIRGGARRVWDLVDRPNLLVRIPASPAGLGAIEESIAARVSVDAALIFSPQRYHDVAEAYARGIERLIDSGGDAGAVSSVASFAVSRVDAEVDRRLDAIGGAATRLKGRLAIATARLVYRSSTEVFESERWRPLAAAGARRQRCRWTSTSTENSPYSDVFYLEQLIGAHTVTTVRPEAVAGFEAHGVVADRLGRGLDEARLVAGEVQAAGVDLEDVWTTLEAEGVRRSVDGFNALLESVEAKSRELASTRS